LLFKLTSGRIVKTILIVEAINIMAEFTITNLQDFDNGSFPVAIEDGELLCLSNNATSIESSFNNQIGFNRSIVDDDGENNSISVSQDVNNVIATLDRTDTSITTTSDVDFESLFRVLNIESSFNNQIGINRSIVDNDGDNNTINVSQVVNNIIATNVNIAGTSEVNLEELFAELNINSSFNNQIGRNISIIDNDGDNNSITISQAVNNVIANFDSTDARLTGTLDIDARALFPQLNISSSFNNQIGINRSVVNNAANDRSFNVSQAVNNIIAAFDSINTNITGTSGKDLIVTGTGNDTIKGLNGDDTLYGNGGNDLIDGNPGSDTIDGNRGNDTLNGGVDQDLVSGDVGNDVLNGGFDDDTVDGGAGNDAASGGEGNDSIVGGTGRDTLNGGNGNDSLWGGEGNDLLYGNSGNDTLFGGTGRDTLNGSIGSDVFVLEISDSKDIIVDYVDGTDLLGLSSGLTYEDLTIAATNNGTSITHNGMELAQLLSVDSSLIAANDFIYL
jgi:Ca2+-binding RTX toxin-like protein